MIIDGQRVYDYRIEHGITIEELADMLNIDADQLYNYENQIDEWYEEDYFVILAVSSLIDDMDFIKIEDINVDDIDEILEGY